MRGCELSHGVSVYFTDVDNQLVIAASAGDTTDTFLADMVCKVKNNVYYDIHMHMIYMYT